MKPIEITYFSDVLCIWAYVAQARVDAIKQAFGSEVRVRHRFCSVFGDARNKIASGWRDKGEFAGYSKHVTGIAERFPHVRVDSRAWLETRPVSSASPHLFLTAVAQWEGSEPVGGRVHPIFEDLMWAFRRSFFAEGSDIADRQVQRALAEPFGVDIEAVERLINQGDAFAGLAADYQDADKMGIEGSPTFVLNNGRQKIFGNVGYRIIEANIKELLREPNPDQASWC